MPFYYQAYVNSMHAAKTASHRASSLYVALVKAINANLLKVDTNYGGLIITTIWAGKPQAWRPRPLREYAVQVPNCTESVTPPTDLTDYSAEQLVHACNTAHKVEADAWAIHNMCYEALVAAYVRGELPAHEVNLIERTAAYTSGYAVHDTPASVRIYEIKPPKK